MTQATALDAAFCGEGGSVKIAATAATADHTIVIGTMAAGHWPCVSWLPWVQRCPAMPLLVTAIVTGQLRPSS